MDVLSLLKIALVVAKINPVLREVDFSVETLHVAILGLTLLNVEDAVHLGIEKG